ncbi:Uncharacterized HTH-type transcriptional regulator YyaN [Bacillus sp. 349Y]|nr:Uncharacterized HTH-type transcriptional regulator YyaN [Bacillus sp. 349Y]
MIAIYTIGQTSEKTGFSRDTLRYYEKVGLIPPPSRLENGRRVYTDDDIETLHLLSSLKSTGLSIEEMTDIVKARKIALPNREKKNDEYRKSVQKKIAILHKHIHVMELQKQEIEKIIQASEEKIRHYEGLIK